MVDRPRARAAGAAVGEPQSRWFLLRRPLMFIVVLVGLYYFTTQRPLWENSLTLLTGFAAAITAFVNVIKLLSDKTRGSQATATSGSGSASK